MLLAIDCGNTNTVFSIWDGEAWLCTLRTSTHHSRTADAYFTWFSTLIGHYNIKPDITDVVISSTVPRVVWNLRVFADRFFDCRPLVVGKPECLCLLRLWLIRALALALTGWPMRRVVLTATVATLWSSTLARQRTLMW